MYTMLRYISPRSLLLQQIPTLFISLAIAEFFYKFGSFLFECIAFLATWYILDAARVLLAGSWSKSNETSS